jgi:hypothetical protein
MKLTSINFHRIRGSFSKKEESPLRRVTQLVSRKAQDVAFEYRRPNSESVMQ